VSDRREGVAGSEVLGYPPERIDALVVGGAVAEGDKP